MSYSDDVMRDLTHQLKEANKLIRDLKVLNNSLERLTIAIEKQNKLKEIELGIEKGNQKTYGF